ncbi:alpha/beta-hydrolase [Mycena rebaudengoi]|nr:alpha/beta-hydrolase [Mycena rebaudengoi]
MSGILELRYGTWASPITSDLIAKMSVSIEDVVVDSVTSAIHYIEKRPEEGGRNVILALADGLDIFGEDWNAQLQYKNTVVHQPVFDVLGRTSSTLTVPKNSNHRFADFAFHSRVPNIPRLHINQPFPISTGLILTCRGMGTWKSNLKFFIAAVDVHGGRLSLSADRMSRVRVAGQPMWLDVGTLVFSCDISGYHNPWVSKEDTTRATYKIDSTPLDFTDPSWWLGGSNYAILDDLNILFAASKDGQTASHIITSPFVMLFFWGAKWKGQRLPSLSHTTLTSKDAEAVTYQGLSGEHPPAVLNVHGGPTSLERQNLNLEKQFFTSRDWAWIDVNYSGSSNYGRKYMDRLKGNWDVFDVQDWYTTLAALLFAAGTSSYGVSDLHKLVESTHKSQSHYVQTLIGGNYEEILEVYRARSPIFHAKNIRIPFLILQGSLDPIVPPDQAENMIKVIVEQGGHAEYTLFEGESHGWRKAETIAQALDLELDFYQRTLHLLAW